MGHLYKGFQRKVTKDGSRGLDCEKGNGSGGAPYYGVYVVELRGPHVEGDHEGGGVKIWAQG